MVDRRAMSNGLLACDIKTFPLTLILSVVGDSSIIAVWAHGRLWGCMADRSATSATLPMVLFIGNKLFQGLDRNLQSP